MRIATVLLLVLAIAVAGCGSSSKVVTETGANGQTTTRTVPDVHFAKTKFVLHAGLAFGAFHRYIYKPFRAGAFHSGASGRVRAFAKAAAAGLFAVHELKQARRDALSDDHLRPLADRVSAALNRIGGLAGGLRGHVLNPAGIAGAASAVSALGRGGAGAGAPISDRSAPIPGT